MNNTVFLQVFNKSLSSLVKIIGFLKQICDFEGLGEEREQTQTPTNARINRLGGGWWWRRGAVMKGGREERDDRIDRF